MERQVQSLEVVYFIHETEDARKVESAVEELLSVGTEAVTEVMQGHFGNRITRVRYHLKGADAQTAFGMIANRILPRAKEELRGKLSDIVDEHASLFLRFDKQRLVSGELVEGREDPVRVKVRPRAFAVRGRAEEFYSGLLSGSR